MNYKVGDLVTLSDYGKECQVRHPTKQCGYGIVVRIAPNPLGTGSMVPYVRWFDSSDPERFVGLAFIEKVEPK